jgi:hypothetical protein
MQYCAVLSPDRLEAARIAEILAKNDFQLVSKNPEATYDSRDIQLNLFVDFRTWDTVLASYAVYRVVGPEKRRALFRFENTPLWVKWRYYAHLNFQTMIGLIKYYLTPKDTSV